tara:strand:+ start:500 stop:724 length:225 start_codon:yes stop_codon:yes gene_type:complete
MTPQEKAISLVDKFEEIINGHHSKPIESALIAVDEIINSYDSVNELNCTEWNHNNLTFYFLDYWEEVKQEINKL